MTALNIAQVKQDFDNGTLICRATIGKVIAMAAAVQSDVGMWKELAEEYYGKLQYPNSPELAQGALDALFEKMKRERAA